MQHHFDVELACKYGVLEAILLNHFQYWIQLNEANNKNYYEGKYWTFNSMRAFKEIFPYVSEKKIRNTLKHLQEEGLLITGNFNKSAYDRTLWYAFSEKAISILLKGQMEIDKKENGNVKKGEPIPYNNTYNNPYDNGSSSIDHHNQLTEKEYIKKYASVFPTYSRVDIEILEHFEEQGMEDVVICNAINEAVKNNVRKLNYIEKILYNWLGNNIKTLIQLEAYKKQRKEGANNDRGVNEQNATNAKFNELVGHKITRL